MVQRYRGAFCARRLQIRKVFRTVPDEAGTYHGSKGAIAFDFTHRVVVPVEYVHVTVLGNRQIDRPIKHRLDQTITVTIEPCLARSGKGTKLGRFVTSQVLLLVTRIGVVTPTSHDRPCQYE